jgi:hypothetical protein
VTETEFADQCVLVPPKQRKGKKAQRCKWGVPNARLMKRDTKQIRTELRLPPIRRTPSTFRRALVGGSCVGSDRELRDSVAVAAGVDDTLGNNGEFCLAFLRYQPQHLKGAYVVHAVAFHDDAFGLPYTVSRR